MTRLRNESSSQLCISSDIPPTGPAALPSLLPSLSIFLFDLSLFLPSPSYPLLFNFFPSGPSTALLSHYFFLPLLFIAPLLSLRSAARRSSRFV